MYFSDCPQVQNEINRAELKQASLIKVTEDYHKYMCPDKECTVYAKTPPRSFVRWGISLGTNDNMINLRDRYLYTNEHEWAFGPNAGLQLDFINTGSFERFFLTMGIYYSQINHDVFFPGNSIYFDREIKFLSKNIYIDLLMNYIYPRYKIKPFIGLGLGEFLSIKSSENKSPYILYNPALKSFGPEGRFGIIGAVSKRIFIKIYGSYQYGIFNMDYDATFAANSSNVDLIACLLFVLGHNQ